MDRRKAVTVVALLFLTGAALAAAGDSPHGLAGTWTGKTDFNFVPDPTKPAETVKFYLSGPMTFTADGRIILVLPTGAGHPNAGDSRVACLGEWRPKRPHHDRFETVVKCMYNQNWDDLYGMIRGTVHLAPDGRTFKWYFSYIDYNGDGSVNWDEGRGVTYGTRLEF